MTVAPKSTAFQPPDRNGDGGQQKRADQNLKSPEDLVSKLVEVQRAARREAESKHLDRAAASVLRLEAELRSVKTFGELAYFIANEPRALLGAQQVCVLEKNTRERFVAKAVSSISVLDRSAPVIHWFECLLRELSQAHDITQLIAFDADAFAEASSELPGKYPLDALVWVPFVECDGTVSAGMLLARSTPWTENDKTVASYLGGAISHTWQAHRRSAHRFQSFQFFNRKRVIIAAIVAMALGFIPVPMTALAPTEIVARNPFVVTSGVAGVVEDIHVTPNSNVQKGDVLVQLNDTVFRNKYELAKREVLVGEARYKKAAQLAFRESRGRQELGITHAELQVKRAELAFAKEMFERTKIKAGVAGVATFTDANELIGLPLNVGEKLMEIANPAKIDFRIELPAADALVLKMGARVKVFLDSDPLHPVDAQLVRADYRAKRTKTDTLAFRLIAQRTDETQPVPRLGVRGTAQVYSDDVTLAFYLFRRPLGVLRQWGGL